MTLHLTFCGSDFFPPKAIEKWNKIAFQRPLELCAEWPTWMTTKGNLFFDQLQPWILVNISCINWHHLLELVFPFFLILCLDFKTLPENTIVDAIACTFPKLSFFQIEMREPILQISVQNRTCDTRSVDLTANNAKRRKHSNPRISKRLLKGRNYSKQPGRLREGYYSSPSVDCQRAQVDESWFLIFVSVSPDLFLCPQTTRQIEKIHFRRNVQPIQRLLACATSFSLFSSPGHHERGPPTFWTTTSQK